MTPVQTNTQILIALFKSTVEQSTALTKEYKQKAKQEFNIWQQQGFKLLSELEKQNQVNEEYVNNITDIYHNISIEIRNNLMNHEQKIIKNKFGSLKLITTFAVYYGLNNNGNKRI